jgi:hypothetical protein
VCVCVFFFGILFVFFFSVLCSLFFSFLPWNSLWLVEDLLTLHFLILIVRTEISWFLWDIFFPRKIWRVRSWTDVLFHGYMVFNQKLGFIFCNEVCLEGSLGLSLLCVICILIPLVICTVFSILIHSQWKILAIAWHSAAWTSHYFFGHLAVIWIYAICSPLLCFSLSSSSVIHTASSHHLLLLYVPNLAQGFQLLTALRK